MRTTAWWERSAISLVIALLCACGTLALYLLEPRTHFDVLSTMEAKLVDLRFRMRGRRPPSIQVAIVAIDSKSIREIGRWPWSRREQAALVDRLREWKASTIAFDVLFTEPEGSREADVLRRAAASLPPPPASGDDPQSTARRTLAAAIEEVLADKAFAASLAKTFDVDTALPVLAYDFVFPEDVRGETARQLLSRTDERVILDAGTYATRDRNAAALSQSPPRLAVGIRPVVRELAERAAALGFVNPVTDRDGALRRESVVVSYGQPGTQLQAFMPLAVAAVVTHLRLRVDQVTLDLPRGELRIDRSERDGGSPRVFRFDPEDGTARIDFCGGARTFPTYSFVDVLRDELHDSEGRAVAGPDAFRGRLVFVGATDPGLGDFFVTPFTSRLPGVEMHANVADNLLDGRQLLVGSDYDLSVILTSLAAALLVALVSATFRSLTAVFLVAAIGASWVAVTFAQFARSGILWNWTVPGLTAALGFTAVTAYRQLTEERAKRHIRSVFSTYVAPAVVSQVLDDPTKLKLGGTRSECTIFFSDVVGFTTLAESIEDAEKLVTLMNRYLGRMTHVILERGGMLDKYIGDAIMAVFGAPIAHPDHAARACRAALGNLDALRELRAELRAEGLPEIDCRIGINTGEVVVGNVGSELRMDYTVLGDPVNLASRLESANKEYGTHVLVSEQTRTEAERYDPNLVFRPLDRIAVKGKSIAVEICEVVGDRQTLTDEQRRFLETFRKGLDLYRSRSFAEAQSWFEKALLLGPDDRPTITYIARCRQFVLESPPESWNTVFEMQTK